MIIGVARKSRPTQNIERQVRNILAVYPQAKTIKITVSGSKVIGYKEFVNTINKLKEGDKLIFDSASRMSRNSEEGCKLYEELFNRGVCIEFLKEPYINTEVFRKALQNQIEIKLETGNKATDELVGTIIEALNRFTIELAKQQIKKVFDQAEKELIDLHQRTKEGMLTAKIEGKQIGQPKGTKLITKKSKEAKAIMKEHCKIFGGTLRDKDCIKLADVDRGTFYKYKRELINEMADDVINIE